MNSFENWLKEITIYHKVDKNYVKYYKKASVRNTSIQNRNNTGVNNVDNALIRIFDVKEYNNTWSISKGDIIVNKRVEDNIIQAPLTELKKKYGEENVYQVKSIDINILEAENDLNHIKIGAI